MNITEINDIQKFYETEKNTLFSWALIFVGDRETAEDIVHDVFVKLLRQKRLPQELRPYVFRAIRNTAINSNKRKMRTESLLPSTEIRLTGNNGHVDSLEARLTIFIVAGKGGETGVGYYCGNNSKHFHQTHASSRKKVNRLLF